MIVPYPYTSLSLVSEDDRHWRFLCPFHKETEGSFTVNKTEPFKLFYRCWACGANGNAKTFATKYLGHDPKLIDQNIEVAGEFMEIVRPKINWDFLRGTPLEHMPAEEQRLAEAVGVSVETIRKFGIGWRDYRFLIPMYDESGICGISTREHLTFKGETRCNKRCVKGSKHGTFQPKMDYSKYKQLFICEGWSDTATLIELGFAAVGRFNAGHLERAFGYLCAWGKENLYIITDNDEAGLTGSQKLQKLIGGKIISPPEKAHCYALKSPTIWYKDIREFFLHVGKERCREWLESQL
jgi:5S rRNA maturation endonuclease (ribonuclease M5)